MSDLERFELRSEHVALLRRANVSWGHCEWGAPCIDGKRPFGNGDLYGDMVEILGLDWKDDEDGAWTEEQMAHLDSLFKSLERALQVVLAAGSFEPGVYVSDTYLDNWRRETVQ